MEKVIKVKNLEELKKYGIEYIPPYPKEKLNEEYENIISTLFQADVVMKLVCMEHKNAERGCIECPLYTNDGGCIHARLKHLTTYNKKVDKEIERREEAWADEHGLTGDE